MLISIQQPEFFPWPGFFNKIKAVDRTVILDNVQFKKRYFENRCKIKMGNNSKWLTVPVSTKGKYLQKIGEVKVDNDFNWGPKAWNTLIHTYKKAPYWNDHKDFLYCTLVESKWEYLLELNLYIIRYFSDYLGIPFDYKLASEMDVNSSGSDLVLDCCLIMKANKYLSGKFGKEYLDEQAFKNAGVEIHYQSFEVLRYPQIDNTFVYPLSILDLILNIAKETNEYI